MKDPNKYQSTFLTRMKTERPKDSVSSNFTYSSTQVSIHVETGGEVTGRSG